MGADLILYTVYCRPSDYPDEYVIRRSLFNVGKPSVMEGNLYARGASLDEVRAQLPAGLLRLPPDVQDDPVIAEVWL